MLTEGLKKERMLILILLLGFAMRMAVAWGPQDWVINTVLSDDAFIYLRISENIFNGCGPINSDILY